MEELQTDTITSYEKTQTQEDIDTGRENENVCAANLLNGSEEVDDSLDLMADHCDNESIGSNSDVWKGSDSEDDNFENKENSDENIETNKESEKETDKSENVIEVEDKSANPQDEKITEETTPMEENNEIPDDSDQTVESEKPTQPEENDKSSEITDEQEKSIEVITLDNETEEPEEILSVDPPVENQEPVETPLPDTTTTSEPEVIEERTNSESTEAPIEETEKEVEPIIISTPEEDPANKDNEVVEILDKDPLADATPDTDPLDVPEITEEPTENRHPNRLNEGPDDDCQMDYDAEDDDDFDPSLLCPEVSMAVDDNPVVTTNGAANEGADESTPSELTNFVDEVTGAEVSFNLSAEEHELRKRLYGARNRIQFTKIHCTACNIHLGSALEGQNNRFVHPLLKVMICKKCYHFYTSGDFDKDEDGSELYCRWCGQGGQVLCCSHCEFVFCKRCIRTNFGRKKMFEIRDSDSWDCFRCNQSQIITQRIACYEFFEYIRREMPRASTLNSSEIWSTDYSRCCGAKKRALENGEEVKKPKKKKSDVDPDYNPLSQKSDGHENSGPPSVTTVHFGTNNPLILPNPIQLLPRYAPKDNDIEFVRQIPPPHVTIGAVPRTNVNRFPTPRASCGPRPSAPRPTYRTILPSHIRPAIQPGTLVRISAQPAPPPLVPTGSRILGTALQNRNMNASSMMKHEWFEKTVRAAARVNSHLSYTLTQLNKAQSQAASVEELAVVHNKLQEILSSSINSLIQIRKNLRTEFIAGIKTVRLPSKKVDTFNNDDDVIFVSAPPTMPMPSTSFTKSPPKDPLVVIDKTPAAPAVEGIQETPVERPKAYLKVKSVLELQNVPSECITIPDDPPVLKPNASAVDVVCNGNDTLPETLKTPEVASVPTIDLSDVPNEKTSPRTPKPSEESSPPKVKETRTRRSRNNNLVFKVNQEAPADVKRMMAVKVFLPKVNLEELQKKMASKN